MPETRTTTVSQNKEGQYQVTVPRDLGHFFDLEGKKLEWRSGSAANKMEVTVHDDD